MYRPEDSRHFRADQSSTFVPQSSQTFDLNYADGSHLRGFSGVDQVYMGDYKATSPFGMTFWDMPDRVCAWDRVDAISWKAGEGNDGLGLWVLTSVLSPGVITDCNSPDFNGVDGILGFGLPKAGSDLPTPVLFAMTDEENKDTNGTEQSALPMATLLRVP